MKITPEMQEQYNVNDPQCPVCTGKDIDTGTLQIDGRDVWVEVECENCGATWQEVYGFSNIDFLKTNDEA